MRNYAAMYDAKLLAAIADLRAGTGEATAKAVGAGRSAEEDLPAATAAAVRRGLLPPGTDAAWDAVRDEAAVRLRAMGAPDDALAALRPTGRLVGDPDGGSQLGGAPRLAPGTPWPERDGRRLHHLAQIDLTTAPAALHSVGLPTSGLLTVFYDADLVNEGDGGWGEWPTDIGAVVVLLVDAATAGPAGASAEPVVPVRLALEADLGGVGERLEDSDADDDLVAAVYDLQFGGHRGDSGGHKVLGIGDPIQGPVVEECPTKAEDEAPPAGAPDLRAAKGSDWRLLLQIDSDDDLGWMWGDVGTVYVLVQHDDLLAGRVDRAWTIMQCS